MNKKDKLSVVLSDGSSVNSFGFRVSLEGLDLKRFKANPVMLLQHNPEQVIGRWDNLTISDNKLVATPVFDDEDDLAQKTERKVRRGFLKGSSIGLIVYEIQKEGKHDLVTKSELIEASIVSIPSDAGAVVLYNEKRERLTIEQLKMNLIHTTKETKDMDNKNEELQLKLTAKEEQVAQLEQEVLSMKQRLEEAKKEGIENMISNAINDGKITDGKEADTFKKLASESYDVIKSVLEVLPANRKLSFSKLARKGAKIEGRDDWGFMDWMKKDPKGLSQLKLNDPMEYERLKMNYKHERR